MASDPTSTFYQGPVWCMEWYRSYGDCFTPLVLLMTSDGVLVGVVPLAVEKATGRLTFASDNMADYREVVTRPAYREAVVAEMLRVYKSGSFPNTFRLGPTQPESKTVDIVCQLTAPALKLRTITRGHACWRFWFNEPAAAMKIAAKESVRRHLNYYKRQGPVLLQHITDADTWNTIKDEFFDQHSLRQLAVGRPISFNEPRKREFYGALIEHHSEIVHVTVLRAAGKFIAGHFGYLWRDVLYWGASSFDVREERHSPGQVLIALLLQRLSMDGLNGVDFTLGTEDFKARFGNSCVSLPSVEIYAKGRPYFTRKIRDRIVTSAKALVANSAGQRKWSAIRQLGEYIRREAEQLRESGLKIGLANLTKRGLENFTQKTKELIYVATPDKAHLSELRLAPGQTFSFRTNEINDLLKYANASRETLRELVAAIKSTSGLYQSERSLHTILLNDRLAGWGWSHLPEAVSLSAGLPQLPESHPDVVMIFGTFVLPEYRQKQLEQALLSHILRERFDSGARTAYVLCGETNIALREALESVGFRPLPVNSSQ
ncbi:MAG TPA: GNAT family N-acetyltransferase [Pyrinomonadaceae bacterium]|nr:GNAT family N-acetyltransferase [Pyrinomonadaceae bacterium]